MRNTFFTNKAGKDLSIDSDMPEDDDVYEGELVNGLGDLNRASQR